MMSNRNVGTSRRSIAPFYEPTSPSSPDSKQDRAQPERLDPFDTVTRPPSPSSTRAVRNAAKSSSCYYEDLFDTRAYLSALEAHLDAPHGVGEACYDFGKLCVEIPEFRTSFTHPQMSVGATHLYKGANLTRGFHALGTADTGAHMADRLGLGQNEIFLAFAAGLVHDIGHLPFSHQSEQAFSTFPEFASNPLDHEQVGLEILQSDRVRRLFGRELSQALIGVLHHQVEPLCDIQDFADRLTYLPEDYRFSGLPGAAQVEDAREAAFRSVSIQGNSLVWGDIQAFNRVISHRDNLFRVVSAGYQGALVRETVTEAYWVMMQEQGMGVTEFLNHIRNRSTAEVIQMMPDEYRRRLTFPAGIPGLSGDGCAPVDLEYVPAAIIKYDMLSTVAQRMVYKTANIVGPNESNIKETLAFDESKKVYHRERVMTALEACVRAPLAERYGQDYTHSQNIIVAEVGGPAKGYHVKTLNNGKVTLETKHGEHRWEIMVVVPRSMPECERREVHKMIIDAMNRQGLLRKPPEKRQESNLRWSRHDVELRQVFEVPPPRELLTDICLDL